jgi:hypothetical protein
MKTPTPMMTMMINQGVHQHLSWSSRGSGGSSISRWSHLYNIWKAYKDFNKQSNWSCIGWSQRGYKESPQAICIIL